MNDVHDSTDDPRGESAQGIEVDRRFFVRAGSVNAVRRALFRSPGGAEVVGRYDRETIERRHTMDAHSMRRHWPVIVSRLEKAGLPIVSRPSRIDEPESGLNQRSV